MSKEKVQLFTVIASAIIIAGIIALIAFGKDSNTWLDIIKTISAVWIAATDDKVGDVHIE